MKTILFIAAFNLMCFPLFSQWYQVNSGTNEQIRYMAFFDTLIGYSVCSNGIIIKTVDGGENWFVVYQDTSSIGNTLGLSSIVVTSDSVYSFGMYSQGNYKKISFAVNGGPILIEPINIAINTPRFFNNDIYFINNGLNRYNNGNIIQILEGVEFFTIIENFLSASNATHLYKSDNYGISWDTLQFTTNALSSGPYQSFYNGSDTIFAITHYPATFHYSFDSSLSWNTISAPAAFFYFTKNSIYGLNLFNNFNQILTSSVPSFNFNATLLNNIVTKIYFISETTGFAFGDNGIIYKTTNGGGTVGINVNEIKKKIKIYPNPPKDEIIIEANEIKIIKVEIANMNGKIIKLLNGHVNRIHTDNLEAGGYIIQFYTDYGLITERIIIVKN
ncbi:MAG: T9SS type A sorting domain-containing protein [Bacteroidia bacterium]